MKTLILTPNKTEMCGMYQLAKDLAKEFKADIMTKEDYHNSIKYDEVITFLYPMHIKGKELKKEYGTKWICYDQKIPPITKTYFPNFWRRQAMRYINGRNNATMKGADEYWDVTEREQKPKWTRNIKLPFYTYHGVDLTKDYFIYTGRTTDYKNYWKLKSMMKDLGIPLVHPENEPDGVVHAMLSNAKCYITMSLWEGYGRGVNEAAASGKYIVAYGVGAHKRHIKKGICVPLDINNMKKSEESFKRAVLEVWHEQIQG